MARRCGSCATRKAGLVNKVPSFVVPFVPDVEFFNKYAVVQFKLEMHVTYGASSQPMQPTQVISMPYPLVYALYTSHPRPISFINPSAEQEFKESYNLS